MYVINDFLMFFIQFIQIRSGVRNSADDNQLSYLLDEVIDKNRNQSGTIHLDRIGNCKYLYYTKCYTKFSVTTSLQYTCNNEPL